MYKLIFYVVLGVVFSAALQSSELQDSIERIANGLSSGRSIERWEIEGLFKEIQVQKSTARRGSDASAETKHSTASSVSIPSKETIDGLEQAFEEYIDQSDKTPKQLESRADFIRTLHSMEGTVSDDVITKTLIMIGQSLFQ